MLRDCEIVAQEIAIKENDYGSDSKSTKPSSRVNTEPSTTLTTKPREKSVGPKTRNEEPGMSRTKTVGNLKVKYSLS